MGAELKFVDEIPKNRRKGRRRELELGKAR